MQQKYNRLRPVPAVGPRHLPQTRHAQSASLSREALRDIVAQMID
jgi:hypothetical protein